MSSTIPENSLTNPPADHPATPQTAGTHLNEISPVTLRDFQAQIREMFGQKDASRGVSGTFMWFMEEVGELSASLRQGQADRENLELEFADVLAWLATLANIAEVDLESAIRKKYISGCPRCSKPTCQCPPSLKP